MPEPPQLRSIHAASEKEIAKFAWKCVTDAQQLENFKDYVNAVKDLPTHVASCGLGQTLTFFMSSSRAARKILYKQLEDWLTNEREIYPKPPDETGAPAEWVVSCIMNNGSRKYRRATREVMRLATWLRRLADAQENG